MHLRTPNLYDADSMFHLQLQEKPTSCDHSPSCFITTQSCILYPMKFRGTPYLATSIGNRYWIWQAKCSLENNSSDQPFTKSNHFGINFPFPLCQLVNCSKSGKVYVKMWQHLCFRHQSIGQAPLFLKNKQFTQRLLISFVFLLSLDRCLNNVNNASTLDVR